MVKKIFLAICLASFVAQVSALDRSEEKNSGKFISMRELDDARKERDALIEVVEAMEKKQTDLNRRLAEERALRARAETARETEESKRIKAEDRCARSEISFNARDKALRELLRRTGAKITDIEATIAAIMRSQAEEDHRKPFVPSLSRP